MNALAESLGFEELGEYGLTPVSLYLAAVSQCVRESVGTFARGFAASEQIAYIGRHLAAEFAMHACVFSDGLAHLSKLPIERFKDMRHRVAAGLFEFLLPCLEQFGGCGLQLFLHFRHRLVKTVLQRVHSLAVMSFLKDGSTFFGFLAVGQYSFEFSLFRFKPLVCHRNFRLQPPYDGSRLLCLSLKTVLAAVRANHISDSDACHAEQHPNNYLHCIRIFNTQK